jgi:hypothetical protein
MEETPDGPITPPKPAQSAYRSIGSVVGGAVVFAGALAFMGDLLASSNPSWIGAAVLALIAVLAFILGMYPAVFADEHRLLVRNPFRRIEAPWPRVERVAVGLSMVAITDANRYTIWAVPVSMRERRKQERLRLRARTGDQSGFMSRATGRGKPTPVPVWETGSRGYNPTSGVPFAEQALREFEERREACADELDDTPRVLARWTWPTLAALGLSVLLVVLAAVLS